mmetsp:Transcript_12505/g.16413  ORF Transcript_12505/g.16413 Transcript_12505/m.16413 type:complete len:306 (-) Transcript_12505:108-1025(-)
MNKDLKPSNVNFPLLFFIYVAVRRLLNIAWLRINKFLVSRDLLFDRKHKTFHKVLIIGDGFAEGVCDWVAAYNHSGVSKYLYKHVYEADNLRQTWAFVNRGRAGTISEDWIPDPEEPEEGEPNPKRLFEKMMDNSATNDAAVVVIIVGTMDVVRRKVRMPLSAMNKTGLPIIYEENDLCNTVKNIRKIATAFRDQGKKVVICDVMTSGAGLETHKGVIKRLNRQIKQVVTDTEGLKLVQLSDAVISRDMNRGFDGLHLNYKGYKIFAKKIFECIQGDLVAAEFNVWRPIFSSKKPEAYQDKTKHD